MVCKYEIRRQYFFSLLKNLDFLLDYPLFSRFASFSFSLFFSFPLFPFLFLLRFTVRRNLLSDARGVSLTPLTPLPVRLCI